MGHRVHEQRIQRGMPRAEPTAPGMSRQAVISIGGGRHLPSLPLTFRIARFFDVTADKMFGPEEREAVA